MVQKRTLAIGVKVIRNKKIQPKKVVGISAEKLSPKKVSRKRARRAA
jgi:hypothetical protein